MTSSTCALGVDLGGTKIEVALVEVGGRVQERIRQSTDVDGGPPAIQKQIVAAVEELREKANLAPVGVGIGFAGQIERGTGVVRFSPNLGWKDVPFQSDLASALGMPVAITNDVRAATWGEWLYGAGKDCDDLICLFVGTGIGGSVVSGGRMLTGCSNTAGEVGHMTIDLHGPVCRCGNTGCLEALAGGWAIARDARDAVRSDPGRGRTLLDLAGGQPEKVTAKLVADAFHAGDSLARQLMHEATAALIAGAANLVNAFNPCRLILGGGVIEGLEELVHLVDEGVRQRALNAATVLLQVVRSQLGQDAGVIGAAAMAIQSFSNQGPGT